jgi:hypothetical protein
MHSATLELVGDNPEIISEERSLKIDFLMGSNGQASDIIKDYCRPAKRTSEGFLVFEAIATLAGVFEYADPEGNVRREFRQPWELFYGESMQTVSGIPLTDDHPDVKDIVKPDNWSDYTRGTIFPGLTQEDEIYAKVSGVCYDKDLIEKIESGQVQLSSGLLSRDIKKPGVWRGQPYDVIQTSLVWNHLASVPRGRMGERAALRLDSADASLHNPVVIPQGRVSIWKGADLDQSKGQSMSKVKVNMEGHEIEVDAETGFEILKAQKEAVESQLSNLTGGSDIKLDSVDPEVLSQMITDAVSKHLAENKADEEPATEPVKEDMVDPEPEEPVKVEEVVEDEEEIDLAKENEMLKGEIKMLRAMLEEKGSEKGDEEDASKMDSADEIERKQVAKEIGDLKLDSIDLSKAVTASADDLRKMAVSAFIEKQGLSLSVPESSSELRGMYNVLLRGYSKQEAEKGSRYVADAFQRKPEGKPAEKPLTAAERIAQAEKKQRDMYGKRKRD